MTRPESPLSKSIGLSGAIRWFLGVASVIAIGAALSAGQYAMAAGAATFLIAAIVLGYRAWRARQVD